MPKVKITNTKGLVQEAGSGLDVRSLSTFTGNATFKGRMIASGASVLQTSETFDGTDANDMTGSISASTVVTIFSASGGAVGLTLPTANVATGQVKYIFVDNVDNTCVLSGTNQHGVATEFNAVGDSAICRFDGNMWSIMINNT
tara:strand:+ start:955 stop:1386 length:432 start_codon:yes stop_codon:yes gene_type:complete